MQWPSENAKFALPISAGFSFLACFVVLSHSSCQAAATTSPVVAAAISSTSSSSAIPVKCRNEEGQDVDWFIAYKLPKIRTSANPLVRVGLAYAFILPRNAGALVNAENSTTKGSHSRGRTNDGRSTPSQWILSEKGIHSPASIVGQTLANIYTSKKDDDSVAYLTYNDQPPVGPTADSGGHSKGIIVTSLASGFWIQHSVPHFPLISATNPTYSYPGTGKNNGQVFHCISLPSSKDVDDLGKILEITRPHLVNFSFPSPLKEALPQLQAIVNHHLQRQNQKSDNQSLSLDLDHEDNSHLGLGCENEIDEDACEKLAKKSWDVLPLRSVNGMKFKAFAKGPSFHEDIYSAWIAPNYSTKLEVQSWLNGPNPYQSNCTLPNSSVYNILDKTIAGQVFSTHNDHSKWAVSPNQQLVCISDLNRMEHQTKRGGVTVCFMDSDVWTTFNSSVIDIQPCPTLLAAGSGGITLTDDQVDGVAAKSPTTITKRGDDDEKSSRNRNSYRNHPRHHNHHRRERQRKVKSRTFSFTTI